jgi:hypothetical protein
LLDSKVRLLESNTGNTNLMSEAEQELERAALQAVEEELVQTKEDLLAKDQELEEAREALRDMQERYEAR